MPRIRQVLPAVALDSPARSHVRPGNLGPLVCRYQGLGPGASSKNDLAELVATDGKIYRLPATAG